MREILNAIRCEARSDGRRRMLPTNFGPWQSVYWWFRRFVRRLIFRTIHDVALMIDRELVGRDASPTASVVDSQTVKAPHAPHGSGYDAAKRTKGRERHIAVDTDGRLLMVNLWAWQTSRMRPGRSRSWRPYASAGLDLGTSSWMEPTSGAG